MKTRRAEPRDAAAIAEIYNEGIEDRVATFETESRSRADILMWFEDRHSRVVVVDEDDCVIAFASTGDYKARPCYDGIGEFSVYVKRSARARGIGKTAMEALIDAAREDGFWKLISRIFPENEASLKLMKRLGFREVGVYKNHGKLDGVWKDCIIVEYLIDENL